MPYVLQKYYNFYKHCEIKRFIMIYDLYKAVFHEEKTFVIY